MSNSLRDQLLKAGLVTQQQVDEARQPKPKPQPRQDARQTTSKSKPEQKQAPRDGQAAPQPQHAPRVPRPPRPQNAPKQQSKDDLEQFYKAREQAERVERAEEERRQREIAARRKQMREQINTLIKDNLQNVDDAEIRYNFVVGDNIKYLYVTETQQQALADGTLAITFMEGKRCLIPLTIAQHIQERDPAKIMIINQPDAGVLPPMERPSVADSPANADNDVA